MRIVMGLNDPKCSGGSGFGEKEAVRVVGRETPGLWKDGGAGGLDVETESGTEFLQEGRRALGCGVEVHGVNLGRGF